MIRATCAWMLVLLAASPVTTPFASCDLRCFVSASVSVATTFDPAGASLTAPSSTSGDAYTLSMPVPRDIVPPDASAGGAVTPRRTVHIPSYNSDRPRDVAWSSQARSAQRTILRR